MGRRLAAFAVAGTFGFLTDVSVLMIVDQWFGLYYGRIVSYILAVHTTWIFNRAFAFRDRLEQPIMIEWSRYLVANSMGAAVNYTSYAAVVVLFTDVAGVGPLGVAVGSICGLGFNFVANHFFVFKSHIQKPMRKR